MYKELACISFLLGIGVFGTELGIYTLLLRCYSVRVNVF